MFRVVARMLVEQNRRLQQALLLATATPAAPGYDAAMDGAYFDGPSARGSFRVGRNRRTWLFSPAFSPAVTIDQAASQQDQARDGHVPREHRRCC